MSRLVRLAANVDYKKLPLSPVEGNIFSRIDGRNTEDDIVRLTGFHKDTVAKALDKLLDLAAIESVAQAKSREVADREAKAVASMALGGLDPKALPVYEARELDEQADLEPAKKKQILDGFYRLEKLNYYELLGVHQLVDKKQIKAAYYQVAPEYHPDKFFRKNLGSFKPKIEAIFARLTLAHDVLSSKERRAQYDEYLAAAPPPVAAAPAATPPPATGPTADEAKRQALLVERRRALAAKLGGGRMPSAAPAPAQPEARPSGPPPMDPRQAAEALRVRYEAAKQESARGQLRKYLDTGRDALHQKDFLGAANAFRIAASLAPEDAEVQREAAEANQVCAVALADMFMKQGENEAHQEKWAEAAVSFGKAVLGKPDDARVHDRAAHATFKANNNQRRAVELARRAVELAPKQPMYRVTLAYAYMASGFDTSSKAELDRALEISGGDERVKAGVSAAREALKVAVLTPRREEPRESSPGAAPRSAAVAPGQQPVVQQPVVQQPIVQQPVVQQPVVQGSYAPSPQPSAPPPAAYQPYPVGTPSQTPQPYPVSGPPQAYPLGAAAVASMQRGASGQHPAAQSMGGSGANVRAARPGAYSYVDEAAPPPPREPSIPPRAPAPGYPVHQAYGAPPQPQQALPGPQGLPAFGPPPGQPTPGQGFPAGAYADPRYAQPQFGAPQHQQVGPNGYPPLPPPPGQWPAGSYPPNAYPMAQPQHGQQPYPYPGQAPPGQAPAQAPAGQGPNSVPPHPSSDPRSQRGGGR